MKRKIIPVLIGCTLSFSALAAQPTAERYVVSFPEGTHVNYAGAFASAFPNGLPVGIGSGLLFTGKQGDALTFATITDRGPNADSPKEGKNETKIFVTPDFAPLLMTIRVQNGKAEAIDPRPLHDDKGAINGLPLASDVIGSTNEVAFSDTLHRLKGDNRGLDTEGITPDGNRLHYLADRAGIRGRFRDADAYPLDQAFPLLMKQLKLMLTSGELNPRHQHTVTLYAKGLTCEADTLGSCGYVYLAVYPTPETKK